MRRALGKSFALRLANRATRKRNKMDGVFIRHFILNKVWTPLQNKSWTALAKPNRYF
jgi:hypothetical protein